MITDLIVLVILIVLALGMLVLRIMRFQLTGDRIRNTAVVLWMLIMVSGYSYLLFK